LELVELRRALLLFAVVLGLAAIATSVSRPAERGGDEASDPGRRTPTAGPRRTALQPALISFATTATPRERRLAVNRPATVTVEVARAGQVELAGLGLTAEAQPLTPARFDVLERRPGRYKVRFTPAAASSETHTVGTVEVEAPLR